MKNLDKNIFSLERNKEENSKSGSDIEVIQIVTDNWRNMHKTPVAIMAAGTLLIFNNCMGYYTYMNSKIIVRIIW